MGAQSLRLAAKQRKSNTGFEIRIRSESILAGIKDSYLANLAKPQRTVINDSDKGSRVGR